MQRIIELIMVMVILTSSLFVSYNMGYKAHIEPTSPYFEVTNGLNTYVLDNHSVYHDECINDGLEITYYIYIENSYSRTIIECVDMAIQGNLTTAKDWRDSILTTLDKEIL